MAASPQQPRAPQSVVFPSQEQPVQRLLVLHNPTAIVFVYKVKSTTVQLEVEEEKVVGMLNPGQTLPVRLVLHHDHGHPTDFSQQALVVSALAIENDMERLKRLIHDVPDTCDRHQTVARLALRVNNHEFAAPETIVSLPGDALPFAATRVAVDAAKILAVDDTKTAPPFSRDTRTCDEITAEDRAGLPAAASLWDWVDSVASYVRPTAKAHDEAPPKPKKEERDEAVLVCAPCASFGPEPPPPKKEEKPAGLCAPCAAVEEPPPPPKQSALASFLSGLCAPSKEEKPAPPPPKKEEKKAAPPPPPPPPPPKEEEPPKQETLPKDDPQSKQSALAAFLSGLCAPSAAPPKEEKTTPPPPPPKEEEPPKQETPAKDEKAEGTTCAPCAPG